MIQIVGQYSGRQKRVNSFDSCFLFKKADQLALARWLYRSRFFTDQSLNLIRHQRIQAQARANSQQEFK